MKPGAFGVFFSQPRLSHRMAIALEDAGFHIRDLWAWQFTKKAQFKAFTMNHFIAKMPIDQQEKDALVALLQNRKTPQLRPQFETMIFIQKPRQGSFLDNWQAHRVGLIDGQESLDGKAPKTLMHVEKENKDKDNAHLTVKPLLLIEHLIKLLSLPEQIVLDPFLGSGTTALAACKTCRHAIGIEMNPSYVLIAQRRLRSVMP